LPTCAVGRPVAHARVAIELPIKPCTGCIGKCGISTEAMIGLGSGPPLVVRPERDSLIAEVNTLSDGQRQALEAGVGIQPARSQADSELVGIRNAVPTTCEYVFAKGLAETEVGIGGVEDGDMGLIAVRHIQIVEPRLQCLNRSITKQRRITLEGHARIDGENR